MPHPANPELNAPRAPGAISRDLKANFAELWESLRARAHHAFNELDPKDILAVRHLDDLRRIVKNAYQYDDARVDAELDRFANEGGASSTGPATPHANPTRRNAS